MTATPSGKSKDTLIGNSGAILIVKALTSISVEAVELGVGDSDQVNEKKIFHKDATYFKKLV